MFWKAHMSWYLVPKLYLDIDGKSSVMFNFLSTQKERRPGVEPGKEAMARVKAKRPYLGRHRSENLHASARPARRGQQPGR